jgi:putative tryptophan/tyrosine transport system substrate-binding protein
MRRREFIAGLGGAAALSATARAQQRERARRVGVLMGLAESDPEGQARISAFRRTLQSLGWTEGKNIQVDYRWASGDVERTRLLAYELVAATPDAIVVNTPPGSSALRQATSTIPIVFVQVLDATESGLVANPAKPEANITGFTNFYEYAMAGKWLQLLKEVAPSLRRVAIMQNPNHPSWAGYLGESATAGASLGLQAVPARIYTPQDIDNLLNALAREPNGGLVVLPDTFTTVHRQQIIDAAARNQLPAIYPARFYATNGGLLSYGADLVEMLRLAATYVDRILRGETPSDLPVQSSTKFELIVNLKTARALGLTIPETLLATADEVIQ